ncbi:type IX secretion system plug protein domain-containing protein, partial [Polaribacter sp.]|uniref:type IX secretion system plug protein n=1 Tax=Polaribacter sp. TaxID=1920175 RepID=UPI003F69F27D
MTKHIIYILLAIFSIPFYSQNIKSIQLRPLAKNSYTAIVPLGTSLRLSFDDLEADVKDYRYRIEHMNHNWQKSRLLSSQYINGFDENTIINVTNSFNTLQSYTHYEVQFPNTNTVITKSGNYVVSVLDDYDTVVFSRRFVL